MLFIIPGHKIRCCNFLPKRLRSADAAATILVSDTSRKQKLKKTKRGRLYTTTTHLLCHGKRFFRRLTAVYLALTVAGSTPVFCYKMSIRHSYKGDPLERKDVILVFEGFDQADKAERLRHLYGKVLTTLDRKLQAEWLAAVHAEFGDDGARNVMDDLLAMPDRVNEPFVIITGNGTLSCKPHFGFYDPERDAAMLWLERQEATEAQPVILATLFDEDPMYAPVAICYYLVFRLSDMFAGRILQQPYALNGKPQYLSAHNRDEIFHAAGIP